MFTCPNCKQTIPELLSVQTDKDKVKENILIVDKYNKEIKEYELVKESFKAEVGCHNKNKHWWENTWKFYETDYTEHGNSCQIEDCLWGVVEKKDKPQLVLLKVRYIECPMCHHRHYID